MQVYEVTVLDHVHEYGSAAGFLGNPIFLETTQQKTAILGFGNKHTKFTFLQTTPAAIFPVMQESRQASKQSSKQASKQASCNKSEMLLNA